MIYTMNPTNQYATLERDSEQHFLELASCAKHHFCENHIWKILPSDQYTLICILSGSIRIQDFDREIVRNDTLLCLNFSRLNLEIERNTEFIKITFRASPIAPILNCRQGGTPLVVSGNFPQIKKLYQMNNNKKIVVGVKEAILLDFLNDFNEHMNASSSELSLYKRACKWAETHSDAAISAQDVAIALNCSRAHLNRVMKLIDGECLSEKIVRYRLERIKNLCLIENIAIWEIANRLGFYSPELLCKFFKYHTGMSISEYKRSKASLSL
ncbi:MAG: helix-turn-helix transcriptional regulator [Clostridia bacterium]|nr:helix-turn-helix transcriptional regulator [Clostridia bacterium]